MSKRALFFALNISFGLLSSAFFDLSFNAYAMCSKDEFPSYFPQNNSSCLPKKGEELQELEKKDTFSSLPTSLILNVVDYLDHREHFQLAQTSRRHLFLWGAITRVPPSFATEPSLSEETAFSWDGTWPEQVTPSLAIEVKRNIEKEELRKISSLWKSGTVSHLRFYSTQEGSTVDIEELIGYKAKELLPESLISLVFEQVAPLHESGCYGSEPANLHQIIIKGRLAEAPRDNMSNFIRSLGGFREALQYISFENPALCPEEIRHLFSGIHTSSKEYVRTIEIQEEKETDHDYLLALNDFRLKPLIVHDQGIRITHKRKGYQFIVIPGPARLQYVTLNQGTNPENLPFHQLFSLLSREGVPLRELFPLLRTRTTQRRAELLAHLLAESARVRREGANIIIDRSLMREDSPANIIPIPSQKTLRNTSISVAAFSRSSEVMEVTAEELLKVLKDQGAYNPTVQLLLREQQDTQKDSSSLLRWFRDLVRCFESSTIGAEDLLYSPLRVLKIRKDTVKVAAFRNSRRVTEITVEKLINIIREQGKYHSPVQQLLARLPGVRTERSQLLHWFRQVLEFFEDGENEEQERRESNNAEILLGSSLMRALTRLHK